MTAKRDYQFHVWYMKREGQVSGPFPIGLIRRFVLLGRLHLNDEVSPDREYWQKIRNVPEVIPDEMQSLKTEEDRMRLVLAQIHEDDRGRERRLGESKPFLGRRIPEERRSPEMQEIVARRQTRDQISNRKRAKKSNFSFILFLAFFLTFIIGGGLYVYNELPDKALQKVQCDAPAVPGVNWSYCKKEGIVLLTKKLDGAILNSTDMHGANFRGSSFRNSDLSYVLLGASDLSYTDFQQAKLVGASLRGADLSFARLKDADLSFANLRSANLGGASFEGAKLGNAIWTDGTVCAEGSVGACIAVK